MPSTLVAFRMTLAWISIARSAAAVSVVKYGLPVPAAKITTRPLLEVADRRAADERLGHRAHLDGRHHPRVVTPCCSSASCRASALMTVGQHAHVVAGRAVHASRAGRDAPEDVAAADDDGRLHAEALDLMDVVGDLRGDGGVDAEARGAHQGLADSFRRMRL